MAGLAKVTLIGHLGGDPESKFTPNGTQLTNFSVAVSTTRNTGGERTESTEWFRCTAFGKLADVCSQYLHKGSRVYVEGRLATRTYDAANGEKRFSLDVTASEMQILDSKRDGEQTVAVGATASAGAPEDLDSIPF